ncbi:hypothetical protein BXZ70DRAFT_1004837 [Cristinia sonorae]|uniref:BTB domain-containing protein n=1 Tax=Cristinia sonorae TaxID=1940300 RepID=A0A8K0XTA0_9AGAR|nr:hypothetical protein BXZ70DRAFT_1004837 [Cristinia sonorae]
MLATRFTPSPQPHAPFNKHCELATRHPTLYDVKGDVVLVARQTDSLRQLFRVHSNQFGQWASLLQAANVRGTVYYLTPEGIEDGPCVEMGDAADDVAAFLSTHKLGATELLDTWGITKHDPALPSKIGAILRISHRYQLDSQNMRTLFCSAWPQSLAEWDAADRKFRSIATNMVETNGAIPGRYAEDNFPEAASAIRLAQDVDLPEIIPAAFYHLSRIPVSHDWDARRRPTSHRSSRYLAPASRSAKWNLLTSAGFRRILHGREKILEFMVDNWAKSVFVACHASCSNPSRECLMHYHALTSLHNMLSEDEEAYNDPLRLLQRRFSHPIATIQERFNICKTCAESAWRISMAKRAELWDLLPDFFDVFPEQ